MRLLSLVNRTVLLSLVSVCVVVVSACYRPDTEALTLKVREDCRLAPAGPACIGEDAETLDYLYERWLLDEIDSPAEEECLRDADCGDPPGSESLQAVFRCLRLDDPLLEDLSPDPDRDCVLACDFELRACGDPESCGVDVVDRCLDERDSCVAACPRF